MESSKTLLTATGEKATFDVIDSALNVTVKNETETLVDMFAVYTVEGAENFGLYIKTFMKGMHDNRRRIQTHVFSGSESCVKEWECRLLWLINKEYVDSFPSQEDIFTTKPPKRKVLLFVNPFSG